MSTELATLIRSFGTPEYGVVGHASEIMERAALAVEKNEYDAALETVRKIAGPNGCLGGAFAFSELALQTGKPAKAVACLSTWNTRFPDRFDIVFALGVAAHQARVLTLAEDSLQAALKHDPTNPDILFPLCLVVYELSRPAEALPLINTVLETRPSDLNALLLKGSILSALGRPAEATDIVAGILAKDQFNPRAFNQLARLEAAKAIPFAEAAHCFVKDRANLPPKRAATAFALGRLAEHQSAFEQAFALFDQANLISQESVDLSTIETSDSWASRAAEIRQKFPKSYVDSCVQYGSDSEVPVFILSMPRTGSTLVEQVLASHHDVDALGESFELQKIEGELYDIARKRDTTPSACLDDQETVKYLANAYLERTMSGHGGAKRLTDKMPHNMNRVALIRILFPQAKVIHCVRDFRDMALSIYKNEFTPDWTFTTSLEGIAYETLKFNDVMIYGAELFGSRMLRVAYEDLVADFEKISRSVVAHIGLPWDPACLDFHNSDRGVVTLSQNQVRLPLYADSVGVWRKYAAQLQPFIEIMNKAGAI